MNKLFLITIAFLIAMNVTSQTIDKIVYIDKTECSVTISKGDVWTDSLDVYFVLWTEDTLGYFSQTALTSSEVKMMPDNNVIFPFWTHKKTKVKTDASSGATDVTENIEEPATIETHYHVFFEINTFNKDSKEAPSSCIYYAYLPLNEKGKTIEFSLLGYGNNGEIDTNLEKLTEKESLVKKITITY